MSRPLTLVAGVVLSLALSWSAVPAALAAGPQSTVLMAEDSPTSPIIPGLLDSFDGISGTPIAHATVGGSPINPLSDQLGAFAYVDSDVQCSYAQYEAMSASSENCSTIAQLSLAPTLAATSFTYVWHNPNPPPVENGDEAGAVQEAISPDGSRLYGLLNDGKIVTLDLTQSPPPVSTPFGPAAAFSSPGDIVITPDGHTLWEDTFTEGTGHATLTPYDLTQTPPVAGSAIDLGAVAQSALGAGAPMAISPDGSRLYVALTGPFAGGHYGSSTLDVVSLSGPTPSVIDSISLVGHAEQLVMAPDGRALYAIDGTELNLGGSPATNAVEGVEVLDISGDAANDTVVATYQPPGALPQGGAITPDARTLYVSNGATNDGGSGVNDLLAIALPATVGGPAGTVTQIPGNGGAVNGVAVVADQPASAAFTAPSGAMAGTATTFTAAASSDIATYAWDFGDGTQQSTATASIQHTYASSGTYTVTLTVTDLAGTSTTVVYNGHEVLRDGNSTAQAQHSLVVAPGSGPAPAPAVSLSTGSLTFPGVVPGQAAASQAVTVTNTGNAPLHVAAQGVQITGLQASAFHLVADSCSGQTVAANASCAITMNFQAIITGQYSGQLSISDDANGSPQVVTLSGDALTAALAHLDHASLDLGVIAVGAVSAPQTVTVSDAGQAPLSISSMALVDKTGAFAVTADGCSGVTLATAATCQASVRFSPPSAGTFTAELRLTDNAFDSPQLVSLQGSTPVGAISGHVYQGDSAPVAGADVFACPQSAIFGPNCTDVTSAPDGGYDLGSLVPGPWVLQVNAPGDLFGGSAVVVVAGGATSTQDFHLTAPQPLAGGASVTSPRGTETSGVPSVSWNQPFSASLPFQMPASGPPGGIDLVTVISGLSGAGAGSSDSGLDLEQLTTFGVHFADDGTPNKVSLALQAQVDCSAPAGVASPCAGPLSGQIPGGGGPLARARRGGGPIAHVAGCPGQASVDLTIHPYQVNTIPNANGFSYVVDFGPGTDWTLPVTMAGYPPNFAPPPVDPNFPTASAALALPGKAVNFAINTPSNVYNGLVGALQSLATSQRTSDPQVASQLATNAYVNLGIQGLSMAIHGPAELTEETLTAALSAQGAQGVLAALGAVNGNNTVLLHALLDCPPGQTSLWVDPSGAVRTRTGIPLAGAKVTLTRADTASAAQVAVPNGSSLMSPGNRRNPDSTDPAGGFAWDVLPGFYQVAATHPGCRAASGSALAGLTPVVPVPPAQTDLQITLRCGKIERGTTRTTLKAVSRMHRGKVAGALVEVQVAPHGGRVPAGAVLSGGVSFTIDGHPLAVIALDTTRRRAFLDLPATTKPIRRLVATFSGNGYYEPSRAALRSPEG